MLYKDNVDLQSKSKSADKLSAKLRELMIVCQENLHHVQEFQKRAHNKATKPRRYASGNQVWLNSKYVKTKQNRKLEAKFFGPFQDLYLVGKQAYKLELPKKWKIHDVFHMSLLEQDTTRKEWMDKKVRQIEFDAGDNEEYKVEAIWDSAVYARELKSGYLPGLYYLISWKRYLKEKNTWEPASAVQHLRKLTSSFYNNHLDKPTVTSPAIDTVSLMARSIVKPTKAPKQKYRRPANSTNKQAKKNWAAFEFYCIFGQIWVIPTLDIFSRIARECTWLHVTSRDYTWLHVTACDCTWLLIDLHQNFF